MDLSVKSLMNSNLIDRHLKVSQSKLKELGVTEVTGAEKYKLLADATDELPEIKLAEDFIIGFLNGASYEGNLQCKPALYGMTFYAFDIVNNLGSISLSKGMGSVIAVQKLQEQAALFYA